MISEWTKKWAKKNIPFYYKKSLPSTNDFAKAEYEKLKKPCLILCDQQTRGRGRGQNQWQNLPQGSALFSTWLFSQNTRFHPILSACIGLVLYRALSSTWENIDFSIKPPNDIYIANKKIAGILLESTNDKNHYLFVGIGINVSDVPDIEKAGCISKIILEQDWNTFLNTFWEQINNLDFTKDQLSQIEQEHLYNACKRSIGSDLIKISANADLIFNKKKISWLEL